MLAAYPLQRSCSCLPLWETARICYLEIPAIDVPRSAAFYQAVVGWQSRRRGNGTVAVDDGVGEVSGTWVTGRPPSATPGVLVHIMVDSVASTLAAAVQHGGGIVASIKSRPVRSPRPSDRVRLFHPAPPQQEITMNRKHLIVNGAIIASAIVGAPTVLSVVLLPALAIVSLVVTGSKLGSTKRDAG